MTEFFDEGSYRIFPPTGPHITWITAGKKCNSLGPDWKLAQFNSRNDFYSEACFIDIIFLTVAFFFYSML